MFCISYSLISWKNYKVDFSGALSVVWNEAHMLSWCVFEDISRMKATSHMLLLWDEVIDTLSSLSSTSLKFLPQHWTQKEMS